VQTVVVQTATTTSEVQTSSLKLEEADTQTECQNSAVSVKEVEVQTMVVHTACTESEVQTSKVKVEEAEVQTVAVRQAEAVRDPAWCPMLVAMTNLVNELGPEGAGQDDVETAADQFESKSNDSKKSLEEDSAADTRVKEFVVANKVEIIVRAYKCFENGTVDEQVFTSMSNLVVKNSLGEAVPHQQCCALAGFLSRELEMECREASEV